jgi:hypothetical protein
MLSLIEFASDFEIRPSGGRESNEKKFGLLSRRGKFEARKVSEGILWVSNSWDFESILGLYVWFGFFFLVFGV